MGEFNEYFKLLIALLAIVDVPGNIPVFLQQTSQMKLADRILTAAVAGVATCLILIAFGIFGQSILKTFGISIASFKIMGGLVVLLIALDMLGVLRISANGDQNTLVAANPIAVGIFPLAVPLFAGPGAITAVMVYAHADFHIGHDLHDAVIIGVIGSVALMITIGLCVATIAGQFIGPVTQSVLNRLLGMIVGALGIEFILAGLSGYYPILSN